MELKSPKILKAALSAVLLLSIILNMNMTKNGFKSSAQKQSVARYYVGYNPNGYDSANGTLEKPFASIAAAVSQMNIDFPDAQSGDVVDILIVQNISDICTDGKAVRNPTHNLAYVGSIEKHNATVRISAYSQNIYTEGGVDTTYLAFSHGVAYQTAFTAGGPTVVDDVTLLITSSVNIKNNTQINFNGNDFEFTANTKFAYLNVKTSSVYSQEDTDDTSLIGKKYSTAGWPSVISHKLKALSYMNTSLCSNGGSADACVNIVYGFENQDSADQHLDVPAYTTGKYTFNGDVAIEFKNSHNLTALCFGGNAEQTTAIKGNLNLKFATKGQKTLRLLDGASEVVIGGAIQIIDNGTVFDTTDNGKSHPSKLTRLVDQNGEKPEMWYLNVESGYEYIDFFEGEVGGIFKLKDGIEAIATLASGQGETKKSQGNILDLSGAAGEYNVSFTASSADYTNDLERIVAHNAASLDLLTVEHLNKSDKLFVGWRYEDSEQYPQAVNGKISLEAGDSLIAEYIDAKQSDFSLFDIELRYEGETAIRYIINKNKAFISLIGATDTEYGAIYSAELDEMLLNETKAAHYCYNSDNNSFSRVSGIAHSPTVVSANPKMVLQETETEFKYSICLINIPKDKYKTLYALRGYMRFNDKNNIPSVIYTSQKASSLYIEACDTDDTAVQNRTDIHNDIIKGVEG